MTAQPYMYARLTDGTTNIDFRLISNVGYMMVRDDWAPAIAPLRAGELGDRGPYEEVAEEFTIDIVGTSPADALTKLRTLNLLLEQATRFYRGENVAQVRFEYAPRGSTTLSDASPLRFAVRGRAPGDETDKTNHVIADKTFNSGLAGSVMQNVRVRFVRHGVGTISTQGPFSSAATNNGTRAVVSGLAAETVPGPTQITVSNFGYGNTTTSKFEDALLVVTEAQTDLLVLQAETVFGAATDYSFPADAASNANGNIMRLTPTAANTERVTSIGTLGTYPTNDEKTVAVYAVIRNNSASANYKVRASITKGADNWTPYLVIPATASPAPKWYFLGQLALTGEQSYSIKMGITASATGAGTLDIDALAVVNIANPNNTVVAILKDTSGTLAGIDNLTVDHRLYNRRTPVAYVASNVGMARTYQGQVFISTKSTELSFALLGTGSANSSFNYWRQTSGAGAVLQNTVSVSRLVSHVTPP